MLYYIYIGNNRIIIDLSLIHIYKELLVKYPEIPWRNVMGIRDIIVHHYFDVDADEIFRICKEDIPQLYKVIIKIINDLK